MGKEIAINTVVNNLEVSAENLNEKSYETQFEMLTQFIDHLIQTDFNRLLSILYRVDISEEKLKSKLAESRDQQFSSQIISQMLIDREVEKIASRVKYKAKQ